ncbi:MAG: hypothetical protein KAH01_00970 [Caldisericia bacterium]|nr:hypothetical protein [Caldisericia bacterium]
MTNTILSRTDAELIGKTIEAYGKIVKTEELLTIFSTKYGKTSAYNRIQLLCKNGWFLRIKQGLYIVNDQISTRFQEDVSLLSVSHALVEDSYVSLDYALNHYQMFDRVSNKIVSINTHASRKYQYKSNIFKFVKVKPDIYFGYHTISLHGHTIQIADVEKALLDFLYVDTSFTTASLFFEKAKEHKEAIDFEKLQLYALRFTEVVQRKVGLLLDHLQINTKQLHASVKNWRGYSWFTKDSTLFNAKWRVYYEPGIIR